MFKLYHKLQNMKLSDPENISIKLELNERI